jgi:nucleotide-binding universal stress UspA family protein
MTPPEAKIMSTSSEDAGRAVGRIVVGVDDTPDGLAALRRAVGLARTADAQLIAVRSWALGLPRHGGRRRHPGKAHMHAVLYLDTAAEQRASADIVRCAFRAAMGGMPRDVTMTITTPESDPGPALTGLAAADGDVLVVGAGHTPSVRHLLHGSVSRYCRSRARCPVMVVHADHDRGARGAG